jgi:hypothetical protein
VDAAEVGCLTGGFGDGTGGGEHAVQAHRGDRGDKGGGAMEQMGTGGLDHVSGVAGVESSSTAAVAMGIDEAGQHPLPGHVNDLVARRLPRTEGGDHALVQL